MTPTTYRRLRFAQLASCRFWRREVARGHTRARVHVVIAQTNLSALRRVYYA